MTQHETTNRDIERGLIAGLAFVALFILSIVAIGTVLIGG